MNTIKRVAFAAAFAAVAALCESPLRAQTPDSAWQTVTNPVARFSVQVPAALSGDDTKTDKDGITTHTFVARQGRTAYVIVYADNASLDIDREMDDARNGLFKGLSATVVAEHRFRSRQPVGETPAAEFTGYSSSMGAELKARTFWHKQRLYMIGVVSPTGTVSMLDIDKFLGSFKITS